jgi:hypothetical protein
MFIVGLATGRHCGCRILSRGCPRHRVLRIHGRLDARTPTATSRSSSCSPAPTLDVCRPPEATSAARPLTRVLPQPIRFTEGILIMAEGTVAADQLRLFIERIERLEEEKKGIATISATSTPRPRPTATTARSCG